MFESLARLALAVIPWYRSISSEHEARWHESDESDNSSTYFYLSYVSLQYVFKHMAFSFFLSSFIRNTENRWVSDSNLEMTKLVTHVVYYEGGKMLNILLF